MPRRRRPDTTSTLAQLPAGTRVLGYLRHSPGQDQRIDSQLSALERYVAERGWVLQHGWWIDEFKEGSSDKREQLQDFLAFARQEPRPAEVVLLWSFSRFARNLVLSQFYLADLRMRGYRVVSVSDDIPDGDFAIIMESLVHWKNEQFLRDLSKDVKRGLRNVVTQSVVLPDGRTITGFSGGGFPPRGYRAVRVQTGQKRNGEPRHNSYWELDPLWQEKVSRAWRMKAENCSHVDIHEACRLFRHLSSYGEMFRNIQYTGQRVNGDVVVDHAHPAYVDLAAFQAIQATLPQEDNHMDARRNSSPFLLSGLVVCGYCGATLNFHPDPRAPTAGQVKCPNRTHQRLIKLRGGVPCELRSIARRKLEAAVLEVVQNQVLTVDHVAELAEGINRRLDTETESNEEQRRQIQAELRELDRRIEKLLDDLEMADRGEQSATIRARLAEREKQRAEARERLEEMERSARRHQTIRLSPEAVVSVLNDLQTLLQETEGEDRRVVLTSFVQRITLWNDHGEMAYTFPFERELLVQNEVPPRGREPAPVLHLRPFPLFPGWPVPPARDCPVCGRPLSVKQLRRHLTYCSRTCAQNAPEKKAQMHDVALSLEMERRGRRYRGRNVDVM